MIYEARNRSQLVHIGILVGKSGDCVLRLFLNREAEATLSSDHRHSARRVEKSHIRSYGHGAGSQRIYNRSESFLLSFSGGFGRIGA
jgi:hypothetical protein